MVAMDQAQRDTGLECLDNKLSTGRQHHREENMLVGFLRSPGVS